jgi:EAL domain-containing protein (putative c-di-GMP-specific phosphodiesterase class I)
LRERGVRLAVDDTGAGYASLNHVLQLRPDIIKLDRSLVSHVPIDPARRALVTALVLLALELGSSVTAEGVETPLELTTLATLGVDHAQGYLLSAPTTKTEDWLRWWDRQWLTGESSASGVVRPGPQDPRSSRR